MNQSSVRTSWWGENRAGGTEAIVLGYQGDSSEYEPFLSLEIDPAWRDAPRERLEGSADWTLHDVEPADVQRHLHVASGIRSSEIYVADGGSTYAIKNAHRHRGEGKSVYLVRTERRGPHTHATLFGGVGWPMDWVRIAEFAWEPPTPKWGLSDTTMEMFSSFANAAAFSTFCVR